MRHSTRWLALAVAIAAVACSDSPTSPPGADSFTGNPQMTGPLAQCNGIPGGLPSFTATYSCGHPIGVVAGSGWQTYETDAVSSGISEAVGNWGVALGQYNLPHFVVGGGGDVRISATGDGAQYCGSTLDAHTIVITRSSSGGCTDRAHLGALFAHELGHALGFGDWYHKFGDAGLDSTVGDCVMWLYTGGGLNAINSTPCMHEIEALYTEYHVSDQPVLNFAKHILTGLDFPHATQLTLGVPATYQFTRAGLGGGPADSIYGPGCGQLAPRMWMVIAPSIPGCTNRLGTVTLSWASSNPSIFQVTPIDSASATLTPEGVGQAVLTVTVSDPAGRYNIGSPFLAAGQQVTATVTVTAPTPTAIAFTAGTNQTAPANTTLPANPTVQVTGAGGIAISGATVDFAIVSGGGSVGSPSVVTNSTGYASTTWHLGSTQGQQLMSATVHGTGLTARDTATATVGPAANLVMVAGDSQSAPSGTTLPIDPSVRVTDASGNGVNGITVTFAATLLNGSVSPASVVTAGGGYAATHWTLGFKAGAKTMTATVTGLTGSPVTFHATATSGGAATFQVTNCRTTSGGGKTYDWFTVTWTGAAAGTHQIYESETNSPVGASVIASGSGSSGSVELGSYTQFPTPSYRYWWLDDVTPAVPNPTEVTTCQL